MERESIEVERRMCARCARRASLLAEAATRGVTRVTLIVSLEDLDDACAERWTAMVRQGSNVSSTGHGHTQEEALYEALRVLGVVR